MNFRIVFTNDFNVNNIEEDVVLLFRSPRRHDIHLFSGLANLPKNKKPIIIPKYKSSLKILQYARDETHRFGVAYNRTIRKNQIK